MVYGSKRQDGCPNKIIKKSKEHWEQEKGNLFRDLDTELRESLYENAHFITLTFAFLHPVMGINNLKK